MKKAKIIVCIVILCVCYLIYKEIFPSKLTLMDCIESGVCQEGLEIYDEGKLITITKEYCDDNNYSWDEKRHTCFLR